jgi:hydroxymethylpyrimidine pyrophosphatase-like HAD family hydrolase
MGKIKLLIFDLDGTALGGHEPYKQFPPEFAAFLDGLGFSAIQWATATTWGIEEQLKLIRGSGVKSDPVMLTGGTGRFACRVKGNELIHDQRHHDEVARLDRAFQTEWGDRINAIIEGIKVRNEAEEIKYNVSGEHIISYKANPGKEDELLSSLKPLLDSGCCYFSDPFRRESNFLFPRHMSKDKAVKLIQSVSGTSPENTAIAGDEANDIPMFRPDLAKCLVCPANAHPELKKIVLRNNGIVATKNYSWGIIEAMAGEI